MAVVGAGPAGLYVAWRLLQSAEFRGKSIALFDAADRVGGRILSLSLPEVPYITELGAMRYLPEQILTSSLVEKKLRLEHADFAFETAGYLLRGKYISQEELKKSAQPDSAQKNVFPYDLHETESGKSPIELIVLAIQRALSQLEMPDVESTKEARGVAVGALRRKLRKLDEGKPPPNLVRHFTGKEWRLMKRYGHINGRSLYEIGFWDLVQQFLTQEGYNLAHDGSGYQSILSMWNAADAVVWYLSDFAGSPYRTIAAGMGKLTERLREDIIRLATAPSTDRIGVFNLGWELKKVRKDSSIPDGPFDLTFGIGEFVRPTSSVPIQTIKAGRIILALPQPSLKSISLEGLQIVSGDSDQQTSLLFHALLGAVTANPLFKSFVVYERPWWRDEVTPSCFRVFTDLPLRQIYHFGSERQCHSLPMDGDRRAHCMLLLYSDARYADYWKRLDQMSQRDQKYFAATFEESISPDARIELNRALQIHGTGDAVLERIQDQLFKVTGKTPPEPITLILKHWSDPPYHAGWHAWNMGYKSWEIAEKLVRPFIDAELFTCGEAFSSEQGWIEGALKSAERVLEKLGLRHPEWIEEDEYEEQKELWL